MANRNRRGQFTHCWGWQGFDREGNQYEHCSCCSRWRKNGHRVDWRQQPIPTTYQTPESTEVVYQA